MRGCSARGYVKHEQRGAIANSNAHELNAVHTSDIKLKTPQAVKPISNLANDRAQPKIARTTCVQADCGAKSMPLAIFASARAWRSHNGTSHICKASAPTVVLPQVMFAVLQRSSINWLTMGALDG